MKRKCGNCLYYEPWYNDWPHGDCMHQLDEVRAEQICNLKDKFEYSFSIPLEWMKYQNTTPEEAEAFNIILNLWETETLK